MNFLARSLSRTLKSTLYSRTEAITAPTRQKWLISQQIHSISATSRSRSSRSSATKWKPPPEAAAEQREWPRPSEIPYQPKVANSINLIGFVDQPVQFEASSDGKFWAGTVVSQHASSSSDTDSDSDSSHNLWIPIIFEGDLAHVAACHLKKNDRIHIAGHLFVDPPPSNVIPGQAHVQVMVQSLNFIQAFSAVKKKDLATSGVEGVLKHSASIKKNKDNGTDSWLDLLDKPEEWWDYRENKLNGSVKPRHPDFKKKDGSLALWLNTAPNRLLDRLEGVKFDVPVSKSRQAKRHKGDELWKDELWKDLMENPDKWWDNREDKTNLRKNAKYPDFKHKETGVGLWLVDSPTCFGKIASSNC